MTIAPRHPELERLGHRVGTLRRKRGLSLERLAFEGELSKGNLSELESGLRNPRYCTLRTIASVLGIPLSKLLEGL